MVVFLLLEDTMTEEELVQKRVEVGQKVFKALRDSFDPKDEVESETVSEIFALVLCGAAIGCEMPKEELQNLIGEVYDLVAEDPESVAMMKSCIVDEAQGMAKA